jgi:hypothetical protein
MGMKNGICIGGLNNMMMRPRKYSALNRSISKSIGYVINQHYRYNKQNKLKYITKSNEYNNNTTIIGVIIFIVLIVASVIGLLTS